MSIRLADIARFYGLLDRLEERIGRVWTLAECDGRMSWPRRGIYLFYEAGEMRSVSGSGRRIVRVGTHALKAKSRSTLWGRLKQHRGAASSAGGNHRNSIFRLLVGVALARRDDVPVPPSWEEKRPGADRPAELDLEARVSCHIRAMPFLYLDVDDEPGPDSLRGAIERNIIALLSGYRESAADPPSRNWLGRYSDRCRVRRSGLWNNDHVDEASDPSFLDAMERRVEKTGPL